MIVGVWGGVEWRGAAAYGGGVGVAWSGVGACVYLCLGGVCVHGRWVCLGGVVCLGGGGVCVCVCVVVVG